ncbi:MAG TPA: hypothetical protein ENN40_06745 [Candidatus Aminicenantes bacterium]|nr:hypothetical protein [Candidatus Aminicenantes bacterium]
MAQLIEVDCPFCKSRLWIDLETHQVVQHQKAVRKDPADLADLLEKERERKQKADLRFSQARELEKAKKEKAARLFEEQLKRDPGKES